MGVNEINDGRESLLTQRLENLRRVNRREGHSDGGGGGGQFQQLFEFNEKGESENEKGKTAKAKPPEALPQPASPRAISPEDIENAKKRDEVRPGMYIDIEA